MVDKSKTAIGYIRVSTDKQAERGASLEAQKARIEAWAAHAGYKVVKIYTDTISAKRMDNREGVLKAIDAACEHGAALVVYSLSRMVRKLSDALAIADQLQKAGADLVSINEQIDTTTPHGSLIYQILCALNEFERRQMGERISHVMQHLKTKGRRFGRAPYGYKPNSKDKNALIEDPKEQRALKLMVKMRKKKRTYREICDELNADGYKTKAGGNWQANTVKRIIERANQAA